jgi:hypothetical protein
MVLHSSLSLVIYSWSPIDFVLLSIGPTPSGVVLLVSLFLPQWPPLWHPILGSRFYPCCHLSDCRYEILYALSYFCVQVLLDPSPCIFFYLLLLGLLVACLWVMVLSSSYSLHHCFPHFLFLRLVLPHPYLTLLLYLVVPFSSLELSNHLPSH